MPDQILVHTLHVMTFLSRQKWKVVTRDEVFKVLVQFPHMRGAIVFGARLIVREKEVFFHHKGDGNIFPVKYLQNVTLKVRKSRK